MNGGPGDRVPMHETATTGKGGRPMTGPGGHEGLTETVRRPAWRPGLRGWGGVGAMAGACALALTATVLFASYGDGARIAADGTPAGPTVTLARQAADGTCDHPEASLRPSSAAGTAVRRIQQRGYLIVGVDQNSYLWGYRDPSNGRIVGFDIDLVHAIAQDILGPDPKIVYKTVPTDQRIPAIRSGDVDMVVRTMSITCDRTRQVAFSTAYFEAGQQLLVPRSGGAVTGFDHSMAGHTVCTASGSTGESTLKGHVPTGHASRPCRTSSTAWSCCNSARWTRC